MFTAQKQRKSGKTVRNIENILIYYKLIINIHVFYMNLMISQVNIIKNKKEKKTSDFWSGENSSDCLYLIRLNCELLRDRCEQAVGPSSQKTQQSTIGIFLNFEILENVAQSCWFQKYGFCREFCGNSESLVEIGSLILEEFAPDRPSSCTLPKRFLTTFVRV